MCCELLYFFAFGTWEAVAGLSGEGWFFVIAKIMFVDRKISIVL
jgi:hypothetical protein